MNEPITFLNDDERCFWSDAALAFVQAYPVEPDSPSASTFSARRDAWVFTVDDKAARFADTMLRARRRREAA